MNDDVLYREELISLRAMIEETTRRPPADLTDMGRLALLHMHRKLTRMIDVAPSLVAP